MVYCFVMIYQLIENTIGNKGAEAIAEALKVNGALQILDLGGRMFCAVDFFLSYNIDNQIGAKGAEAIAEALKVNGVLQILGLGSKILGLLFNR